MFGPVISSERVTLAPLRPEDLQNYLKWLSDPVVTRWMGITGSPTLAQEQEHFKRWAENNSDILWGIYIGDRHIGSTGIHEIDWPNRRAKTGNLIGDRDFWGQGYGSEVVRIRTEYAFTQTTLEKLSTDVFMGNTASRRCLEKSGYRQFGVARHHIFRGGEWHDMWLADVLRDEWLAGSGHSG